MHLLQTACPKRNKSVVLVRAEVCEILQQPIRKFLIPCGTGPPCLGQHGIVCPVVANVLFTEDVLIGGAGRIASSSLLSREFPLGVWQLKKHSPWMKWNKVLMSGSHLSLQLFSDEICYDA